jgi:amino acid permease
MVEMNPYFTASAASLVYFVIFIGLKYVSDNKQLDVQGALIGAVVFWFVIFIVHHFLNKKAEI